MKAVFLPDPESGFPGIDLTAFNISGHGPSTPVKELKPDKYHEILGKTNPQEIDIGSNGLTFDYRGDVNLSRKGYAVYTKGAFGLFLVDTENDEVKIVPYTGLYSRTIKEKKIFRPRFLSIYPK
jgi:hypothetical protein